MLDPIKQPILGIHELISDPSFKERNNIDKPAYERPEGTPSFCPRVQVVNGKKIPANFELAELKSSLLVQNILTNKNANRSLALFISNMMKNILGVNFEPSMVLYSQQIQNSVQKDQLDY